jgi:hypothetical protein
MRIETRYRILIGVSLITVIATTLAPAIPQDPVYHRFADQNNWLTLISGHSLKHIAASVGCLVFLRHLYLRRSIQS